MMSSGFPDSEMSNKNHCIQMVLNYQLIIFWSRIDNCNILKFSQITARKRIICTLLNPHDGIIDTSLQGPRLDFVQERSLHDVSET